MQWMLPPSSRISRPGTTMIYRSGNSFAGTARAASSVAVLKQGTMITSLAMSKFTYDSVHAGRCGPVPTTAQTMPSERHR
jgi:hypothetical protein